MKATARNAGTGVVGLVSLPTRGKPRIPPLVAERAAELRRERRGFVVDQARARLARMRRSTGFAARAHAAARLPGFRADRVLMVTLTYRDGVEWAPGHVKEALRRVRMFLSGRGVDCRYVWVGEVQTRRQEREGGHCVHYHVALWLPCDVYLPQLDAAGWWPHGATRVEVARSAVAYLMKYLSKPGSKGGACMLPVGLRMHGCGGLDHSMRRAARWLRYPSWVKARADIFDDWTRPAVGGGWVDPEGTAIPSEFARAWLGDAWGCVRVADYGRPFSADGPFCWISRSAQFAAGGSH